jgi:hypothetical protein
VTEQCRRYRTYLFSTVYVTPTALRHFAKTAATPDATFDTTELGAVGFATLVNRPGPLVRAVYRKVMSGFAQYLTTAMKSQSTAATTTTVESITITPLVEGSFTVWKVVLSVVNGSGASLVSLSPSFGLPALRLDGAVASGPLHHSVSCLRCTLQRRIWPRHWIHNQNCPKSSQDHPNHCLAPLVLSCSQLM